MEIQQEMQLKVTAQEHVLDYFSKNPNVQSAKMWKDKEPEKAKAAVILINQGQSMSSVAKFFGINASVLARNLDSMGVNRAKKEFKPRPKKQETATPSV